MNIERRRAMTYVVLFVALVVVSLVAADRPSWKGPFLHTLLETIAATIAMLLGVLALVRFYSKKNNVFLFLGTGFLVTAVLDAYHATSLDKWSWLASRTFLSLFFCLNWIGWRRERVLGPRGRLREGSVYLMTALLAAVTILFLQARGVAAPWAAAMNARLEIVPAALGFLALIGYLIKEHWKDNALDHGLIVALVLGFAADGMAVTLSSDPLDPEFGLARAFKLASYTSVGFGLLMSVYSTFRQAEESAIDLTREIAERKRAEEELRKAKDAAESATRAKSEFLAQMSHELRTPLNSIIGFANILRRDKHAHLLPQEQQFLERIRDSGLHLLNLINEVLDLSKVEAGVMEVELETVSLESIVHETVDQFRGQISDRDLVIEARIPPRLEAIVTDPRKLKQILFNLVANAIKFTPRGSVTIEVRADPSTGRPARIDVVDTGIGIPPEGLEAIFEAFRQAESGMARSYGGTGLGLTISRSLARLLGYELAVESVEGEGSVFSVVMSAEATAGTELAPAEVDRSARGSHLETPLERRP